ncbi:MAG: hypothetical protein O4803_10050, partial [Trichodesmium sp. St15_bin1_1]|nr:hypothetical protein [Trichodesmium sp. St15_bin1_1]
YLRNVGYIIFFYRTNYFYYFNLSISVSIEEQNYSDRSKMITAVFILVDHSRDLPRNILTRFWL